MDSEPTSLLRDERGSLTVATAMIITFLAMVFAVAVGVASHTIASHTSRNAADIAAVAGAFAHYRGEGGCQKASEIAQFNGARLESCVIDGMDVLVEVRVGRSMARARAGPI